MKLQTFKTLWGHPNIDTEQSLAGACAMAFDDGFDGVEGPIPVDQNVRDHFALSLEERRLGYIAEICTAGSYVPDRTASVSDHLADLELQLRRILPLEPLQVNCIGGCDRWDVETSCEFFAEALELAEKYRVKISFETHRGRSLYSPWMAEKILDQLALPLTCDFSHWCVVCEGLDSSEDELLMRVASHARHIHGRVGYDQGPQVPDPQNFRYRDDLNKHLRWWRWIWQSQFQRGETLSTLTPEFGPDGYQMINPATGRTVGNLNEFNRWMAACCRAEFNSFITDGKPVPYKSEKEKHNDSK